MKKSLLSIILTVCAFAANAQIFVSLNAGGSMSSGNTNVVTKVSVSTDSTATADLPHDKTTMLQGGFRFGYKTGKIQFGIGASYALSSVTSSTLNPQIMPILPEENILTTGEMTTKASTITVVPFLRYDIIKTGDVALFAELTAFYAMQQDPTVTAHEVLSVPGFNVTVREFDTTFTQTLNSTGYGARITPGLSWELNKYVSLDLYFDFLSIAYAQYTTTSATNEYSFNYSNTGSYIKSDIIKTTTTTDKRSDIDLGIFGTPNWGSSNPGNFVRVGLNIMF